MAEQINNSAQQEQLENARRHEIAWSAMFDDFKNQAITPTDIWGETKITGNFLGKRNKNKRPRLLILPTQKEKRGLFLICAGGAFLFKAAHEAKPVAEYFHNAGFNTAILDYYVDSEDEFLDGNTQIQALDDAKRAIRYLRYHADSLGFCAAHIAIGGFSAGGILSSLAATHYDEGDPNADDPVERMSSRPDAALLLYGAAAMATSDQFALNVDIQKRNALARRSPEKNIQFDSPPFFLFQTAQDSVHGILAFGAELSHKGIPFDMHIFQNGLHGGGLYDGKTDLAEDQPHTAKWAELASDWLQDLGF